MTDYQTDRPQYKSAITIRAISLISSFKRLLQGLRSGHQRQNQFVTRGRNFHAIEISKVSSLAASLLPHRTLFRKKVHPGISTTGFSLEALRLPPLCTPCMNKIRWLSRLVLRRTLTPILSCRRQRSAPFSLMRFHWETPDRIQLIKYKPLDLSMPRWTIRLANLL